MFDTLAAVAYLLGSDAKKEGHLRVQAFLAQKPVAMCLYNQSPKIQWQNVPPQTNSLALIIRDKTHYYWVVYNLPADAKFLPANTNAEINRHDEGFNSWGVKNYHAICSNKNPITVELFAVDKRFATANMTGDELIQKMRGNVIEKAITNA